MSNRSTSIRPPQLAEDERGNRSSAVDNSKDRIIKKIQEAVARTQQKKRPMSQIVDLHPKLKRQPTGQTHPAPIVQQATQQPNSPEVKESLDWDTVDRVLEREISIPENAKRAICRKSKETGLNEQILESVYRRGIFNWEDSSSRSSTQYAFDRVNSFIAGGKARKLDADLWEQAPVSKRFVGTDSLVKTYKNDTPGQSKKKQIFEISKELATRYRDKALKKFPSARGERSFERAENRLTGLFRAQEIIDKKEKKKPVNELSTSLLTRYSVAAKKQAESDPSKASKRDAGVNKAVGKYIDKLNPHRVKTIKKQVTEAVRLRKGKNNG